MPKEEFDPNSTMVGRVTKSKNFKPMAILTTVATVGAVVVALNTFTGLNFRPAWGYEAERLIAADIEIREQLIAAESKTFQRLEKVIRAQDATSRTILQLNKGQYGLRIKQIEREKRDLRRELAEHQSRAEGFRNRNEPVPGWVRDSIADTETTIEELNDERRGVENKLLELER